jgi:hypothetical protein
MKLSKTFGIPYISLVASLLEAVDLGLFVDIPEGLFVNSHDTTVMSRRQ